jgi:hypothetical protein
MARPKGTYVSQVFNFGVDKTIPFGFVDVVFDRSGNTVGFEKDGKFYNLGDKVTKPVVKKALTSDQLDKKRDLLTKKLDILELQASNTNIGEAERNRYIADFNKTQDLLTATEQSFVETQIREGKIKKAEAEAKVAETIRFDLTRLEERKNFLAKLGKPTTEVDTIIQEKNSTLASLQANVQPISGPDAARLGMSSSVLPKTPTLGFQTGFKAETPTTPTPSVPTTKAPRVPTTKAPVVTDAAQREEALNVAAGQDFALPETIFNNVPSLKAILERYVKEDWTPDKLRKAIRDDVWFRKNSAEIKARYVQLYNYQDLVKTGQAQGTTDYEKQIATLERQIADKARAVGSGIASDPAALRKAAENMYITNVGIDDPMTTDFIAAAIRPIGSTIAGQPTLGYSGQALKDYQELQSVARANGFKISDIVPGGQTEQQVLQGIATGRIDANRIAQDARKLAAQGRPQYVRDLLGQGYNLDQVYSPYRQTMANVLELNPDEIDLNDPSLEVAINDKGDMNLSEFKRVLRQDSRWQYTNQAKEEVSNIALKVLKDFGFQG